MKDSVIATLQETKNDFKDKADLKALIQSIKDKKIVMMGEASHGTHDYYNWRAKISKLLMEEHGFDFVAVEGDWPACYELNRHVKNYEDAEEETKKVLKEFQRWPSWMWANWEVHEWAQWLKEFNKELPSDQRKGFYGLDVYSLWESLDAVMEYLKKEDPSALETAKEAMRCFEPHRDEGGQKYALSTRLVPEGCSKEVTQLLTEIRKNATNYNSDREHAFSTEQNALVTKNAEKYYRIMASGDESTWNLRDRHMMDTLNRLMKFHGENAKGIVWAHNTHIGDASFTDMAGQGLYNIGELGREEYGKDEVSLIGFGSYCGSVLAGSSWGSAVQDMELPEGREDSWEDLCHRAGDQFHINVSELKHVPELQERIAHRAVGVVYNPKHERFGNYVPTLITERYDHFLFFNKSQALNPIDVSVEDSKIPETYPYGL
ncbi:erythromycin esterase family protein [Psychroflexus sediminis]|uniref:Erythromycin esterase homolog n=1 Tax=Psychroflexus sediminis TaxID=470826 RepID=A0A1G7W7I8_9FLAO|nr:erythromycin esterase family protein [Psychroflexus sediminis]SDG67985.1 Erythromycin esterase homolog [Psychroflexus sediminis]